MKKKTPSLKDRAGFVTGCLMTYDNTQNNKELIDCRPGPTKSLISCVSVSSGEIAEYQS